MLGVDQAIANREKLAYARCKVEVNVAQTFPDQEGGKKTQPTVETKDKSKAAKTNSRENLKVNKEITQESKAHQGRVEPLTPLMDRILCWNVRGANNPNKQVSIKAFTEAQSLGLDSLLDTKVKPANVGSLYIKLFKGWNFTSNAMSNKNVYPKSGIVPFNCTFIYAFNTALERQSLWKSLKEYPKQYPGPWLIMGDINCVINMEELQKLKEVKNSLKELNRRSFSIIQAETEEPYRQLLKC
ncbi:putative carboxymethylenebutenolidase [Bienertia sinuspersici]